MSPAVLVILSMVATGLSDFLYKRAQRAGIDSAGFLAVQSAFFLLTQVVCGYLLWGLYFTRDMLVLGLVGGVMAFVSFYFLLQSMKEGDASVNSTVFRLGFLFASTLCIVFFGETLTFHKLLGSIAAVLAVTCMAQGGRLRKRPLIYSGVASVSFGFLRFLHRAAGLAGAPPTSILIVQSAMFQICAQVIARRHGKIAITRDALFYGPCCGMLLSMAAISLIVALRFGDGSSIIPVAQLGFLVTAPLAFILLREKLNLRKLLGLGLAVEAVAAFLL